MVPKLNLLLTLVRYIFEVVLIFHDIHQGYHQAMGYYKIQVVHFDPFPVEPFPADSRMIVELEILANSCFKFLPAGYQGWAWAMGRHCSSVKEFQSPDLVSLVMVEMEDPVLENTKNKN